MVRVARTIPGLSAIRLPSPALLDVRPMVPRTARMLLVALVLRTGHAGGSDAGRYLAADRLNDTVRVVDNPSGRLYR